jgi:hypothetical protein
MPTSLKARKGTFEEIPFRERASGIGSLSDDDVLVHQPASSV